MKNNSQGRGGYQNIRGYITSLLTGGKARQISGAWDGAVKVFDVQERREAATESMPDLVMFCAFTRDGKKLVACCTNEIRIWACDNGNLGR